MLLLFLTILLHAVQINISGYWAWSQTLDNFLYDSWEVFPYVDKIASLTSQDFVYDPPISLFPIYHQVGYLFLSKTTPFSKAIKVFKALEALATSSNSASKTFRDSRNYVLLNVLRDFLIKLDPSKSEYQLGDLQNVNLVSDVFTAISYMGHDAIYNAHKISRITCDSVLANAYSLVPESIDDPTALPELCKLLNFDARKCTFLMLKSVEDAGVGYDSILLTKLYVDHIKPLFSSLKINPLVSGSIYKSEFMEIYNDLVTDQGVPYDLEDVLIELACTYMLQANHISTSISSCKAFISSVVVMDSASYSISRRLRDLIAIALSYKQLCGRRRETYFHDINSIYTLKLESGLLVPLDISRSSARSAKQPTISAILTSNSTALTSRYVKRDIVFLIHPSKLRVQSINELKNYINNIIRHQATIITSMCTNMDRIWIYIYNSETQKYEILPFTKLQGDARLKTQYPGAPFFGGYSTNDTEYPYRGSLNSYYQIYRYYSNQDLSRSTFSVAKSPYYNSKVTVLNNIELYKEYALDVLTNRSHDSTSAWDSAFTRYARPSKDLFGQKAMYTAMASHMAELLDELVSGLQNNYYACDSKCDVSDESRAFAPMQYQNVYVFSYSDSNFYDVMQVSARNFKAFKTSRLHFFPVLATSCLLFTDFDVDYPLDYDLSFFIKRLLKVSCDELSYVDSLALARNTRKGILQASNWFAAVLNGATLFLYSGLTDTELRRQLLPLFAYVANYEGKKLFADSVPSLIIHGKHSYMGYNLPIVAETNPCYLKSDGFFSQREKTLTQCHEENILSHMHSGTRRNIQANTAGSNPLFTYRGSLILKLDVSDINFSPLSLDYDALSYMRIYHQDNLTRRYILDPYAQILLFENIGSETRVKDPLDSNSTESYHLFKHSFLTEVIGLRSVMTVNNELQYIPQSVYIYAGVVDKFIRRQMGIFGYIRVGIKDNSDNNIGFDIRISEAMFAYRRYRVPQGNTCTMAELRKMYAFNSVVTSPPSYAHISASPNKLLLSPSHSVLEMDCIPFNGTKVCFQSRAFDQYINVTKFSNKLALTYLEAIVKKTFVTTITSLSTECIPTPSSLKAYLEDKTIFPNLKAEYNYPSNIFIPTYAIFLTEFERLQNLMSSILVDSNLIALITISKFRNLLEDTINGYLSGTSTYDDILRILDNFTVSPFYPDSSINMDNNEMILNYTAVLNASGSHLIMDNILRVYPDYASSGDSSLPYRNGCYLTADLLARILSDSQIMTQEFATCAYANQTSTYVNLSSQTGYETTKLYCLQRPKYFLDPTTEVVSWLASTSVKFAPTSTPAPIKNFGLYSPLLVSYILNIIPEAFRTRRLDGIFHLLTNQQNLPNTVIPDLSYFSEPLLERRNLYRDDAEHHQSFHNYDDLDTDDDFSGEDITKTLYESVSTSRGTIQRVYYTGIYENDIKNVYVDVQAINQDILKYAMHIDKHPLVNIMNSLALPVFMRIYPPLDESAEFITKPRPLDPTISNSPSTYDYLLKILSYQLNTITSSLTGRLHPNFMYNPLNLADSEDWDYGYQPLQNYVQGNPIDEYSHLLYFASFPIYASPQSRIDDTKALAGVYTIEYNISIDTLDSMHSFGVLPSRILPSSTLRSTPSTSLVDLRIPVFYALLNNMGDFVLSRSTNATLSGMKSVLSSILDTLIEIEYFVVRKVPISNERYTNVLEYNNNFWINIKYKEGNQLVTKRKFNVVMVADGVATQIFSSEAGIDSIAYEQSSISDRLIVLDLASTCIKRGTAIIRNLVTVDLMSIAVFNIEYYPVRACTRIPSTNAYTDGINKFNTSIYSHLSIEEDPTIWKPSITYLTGYPPGAHMRLLLQLFGQALHTYISSAETLWIVIIIVFIILGVIIIKIYQTIVSRKGAVSLPKCPKKKDKHLIPDKPHSTGLHMEANAPVTESDASCLSLSYQYQYEMPSVSKTKSLTLLSQGENQLKENLIELQPESSATVCSDVSSTQQICTDTTYDSGILGMSSVTGLLNFLRRPLKHPATPSSFPLKQLSSKSKATKKQLALSSKKPLRQDSASRPHKHATQDTSIMATTSSPLAIDNQPLLNQGLMNSTLILDRSVSLSSYVNNSDVRRFTRPSPSESPLLKRAPHNWFSKMMSKGMYLTFTSLFEVLQSIPTSHKSLHNQFISLDEHPGSHINVRKLKRWTRAFEFLKSALETKNIRLRDDITPFNFYKIHTRHKLNILFALQQLYPPCLKKMQAESRSTTKLLSSYAFSERTQDSISLISFTKQLSKPSSRFFEQASLFKIIFAQLASKNFANKLPEVRTGLSLLDTVQLLVDPATTNIQFSESSSETFSSSDQSAFSFSSSAMSFRSTIESVRMFSKRQRYHNRPAGKCTGYVNTIIRTSVPLQPCLTTRKFDIMDETSSEPDKHYDCQSSSLTTEYSAETDAYLPYHSCTSSKGSRIKSRNLFKSAIKQPLGLLSNPLQTRNTGELEEVEKADSVTRWSFPIVKEVAAQKPTLPCVGNVLIRNGVVLIKKSMSESNLTQLESRSNPFISQAFKKVVLTSCFDTESYQSTSTISKNVCIKDAILTAYLDNLNAALIELFDNPFNYKKFLDYGYEYHGIVRYADPFLSKISPEFINISDRSHILRTNPYATITELSESSTSLMSSSISSPIGLLNQTARSFSPKLKLKTSSPLLYKHESPLNTDLKINPLIPSSVRWASNTPYIPPYTIFAKENLNFNAVKLRAKYARKLMNYNTAFSTMLAKEGIDDSVSLFTPLKDKDVYKLVQLTKLRPAHSAPINLEDISEDNKLFEEITYRKLGILQKRSSNYRANVIAKYLFYRECDFYVYRRFYSPRIKRTVSYLFWKYYLRTQIQSLHTTPFFSHSLGINRESHVEQMALADIFYSPRLGFSQSLSSMQLVNRRYNRPLSPAFSGAESDASDNHLSKMSLTVAAIKEIKSTSTGVLFAEDSVYLHHILVIRALYTKKIAECFYTPLSIASLAGLALPQSAYISLSSDVTVQFPVYALLERFYSAAVVPELSIWNLKETGAETFSVCDSAAYGQFMIARKRAQTRTSILYALLDRNLFYKTQPEYAVRKSFDEHNDFESLSETSLEPETGIIIPRIVDGLVDDSDDRSNDLNVVEHQYDYYLSNSPGYEIDIDDLFNYTSHNDNTELLPILPPQGLDAPQSLGILPPQGLDAPQSLGILPPQGLEAPQSLGILPPQGLEAPQSLGILPPQGLDAPQSLGILPPQGLEAPQSLGILPPQGLEAPQ